MKINFYINSYNSSNFNIEVQNGQLIKIWELKNMGNPYISDFPQYWQNSLAVIDENFHPN